MYPKKRRKEVRVRTAIFIDGGYLEKIIKKEFSEIPIEFARLVDVLRDGKELLRTYYYNCLPYQSNHAYSGAFRTLYKV